MRSLTRIGLVILIYSFLVLSSGSLKTRKGSCFQQSKFSSKNDLLQKQYVLNAGNISNYDEFQPCSFATRSCVFISIDDFWASGCIADEHGVFIQYRINDTNDSSTILYTSFSRSISIGGFCKDRNETSCGIASVTNMTRMLEATVCCCKGNMCTNEMISRWLKDGSPVLIKPRLSMTPRLTVVVFGIFQAVLISIALITMIHKSYSRYNVRQVIVESEGICEKKKMN